MRTVTFYAGSMTQWGVIRPIVERNSQRYRRTFILSAELQTKAGVSDPFAFNFRSAPVQPEDDDFFLKMARHPRVKSSWLDILLGRNPRLTAFHERVESRASDRRIRTKSYLAYVSAFKKTLSYYAATLLHLKTDVLVVGEDGISGELWLIGAAKSLGIPVVVLPYGAAGKEDFLSLLEQKKRGSNLVVPTAEQLALLNEMGCGHWAIPFHDSWAMVYPPEYVVALSDCGISLPNPWTTHGGDADYLMAECQGMQLHYLKEGLPLHKVPIVGTPYADRIAQQINGAPELGEAFRAGRKIGTSAARILISLPPSYHETRGHLSPYPTYEEMTREVVNTVARDPRVKATFVVHPAFHQQQKSLLDSIGEFDISQEWVIDLIPQHDIYISCGSSTLRWSTAARKPTINFDYYKFRLKFFDQLEGLKTIEEPSEFAELLDLLLRDEKTFCEITSEQAAVGDKWGVLDGKNIDRIEDFLLAVQPKPAQAR
jgi:hypothetical protein